MAGNESMAGPGGTRSLKARWTVAGSLCLTSAAHLGNGEPGDTIDMPIGRSACLGVANAEPIDLLAPPILTGASLAGGLRNYLADVLSGPLTEEPRGSPVEALFGAVSVLGEVFSGSEPDEGFQSPLITFDSIGVLGDARVEVRDGLQIDPKSGVAAQTAKFDYEVIPPGTEFPVRVDLLVDDGADESQLLSLLVCALEGLERGEIPIGARKTRGLGRCTVQAWSARRFNLQTREGWLEWLMSDHVNPVAQECRRYSSVAEAVRTSVPPELVLADVSTDLRSADCVRATVELRFQGGLLVRSPGVGPYDADVVHLRSGGTAVLPGTSLAGVLRARSRRIAHLVRKDKGDADIWVSRLFGSEIEKGSSGTRPLVASRLRISESALEGSARLRVTRIKIDRFTGGVIEGALLEEEPEFCGATLVRIELAKPQPGELGFLVLLLKDLITGDLVIGGAGSVGRGVARGRTTIEVNGSALTIEPGIRIRPNDAKALNDAVTEFWNAEQVSGGENA
ncbi:MAG: RAMP superfamily CRISPR-associated protein [Bacillota bacterium]